MALDLTKRDEKGAPISVTEHDQNLTDIENAVNLNTAAASGGSSNLTAVAPPTVNDDSNDGYGIGSLWVDTAADISYICLDPAVGVAVWKKTSIVDHTALSNVGTNTHAQVDTELADHETRVTTNEAHVAATTGNPHAVTSSEVGLSAVTNDAQLKRAAGDIGTFTTKATPVDADVALIEDSAAANAKKKLTWANLKATLKAYFDTLYTLDTDTDVSGNAWVIDEDTLASNLNTKVPTQQSVKAYVDDNAGSVSDIAYDESTWDGVTGIAPSKNAVRDEIELRATKASPAFTGIITLTDGQIAFPATAVPSADPNTLDDYEEGTWTMGVSFGGATVGVTYSINTGYYTKIGNIATVSGYIILTSKGTSTGAALVTGLPFTIINNNAGYSGVATRLNKISFANQYQLRTQINSTTLACEEIIEAGAANDLLDPDFSNTSQVMVNCSYRVV